MVDVLVEHDSLRKESGDGVVKSGKLGANARKKAWRKELQGQVSQCGEGA